MSRIIPRITRTVMASILAAVVVTAAAEMPVWAASSLVTSSPYRNTGYSKYYHNSRFKDDLIVNGLDVSYWQSLRSNWKTAKKNGVDFVILRVTYSYYGKSRITPDIDSKFESHFPKVKDAGLMKGIYVFSQAKNEKEATIEAKYALRRLKALGIGPEDLELPVYMDYEFSPSIFGRLRRLSRSNGTKSARAFCEIIRNAGYQPGIYASKLFLDDYIDIPQLGSDVDVWVAQYWNKCAYTQKYSKWQYSASARIGSGSNGVLNQASNRVDATDANFWYIDKSAGEKSSFSVYTSGKVHYSGKSVTLPVTVYKDRKRLKKGADYIVGYINNIRGGGNTAYAYIKGIGDYSGYALVPFRISKKYVERLGISGCRKAEVSASADSELGLRFWNSDGMRFAGNIPEGTKAGDLLDSLDHARGYKLRIINSSGKPMKRSARVRTGYMIGMYKGSALKGTIEIVVRGDSSNDKTVNRLEPAPEPHVLVRRTGITSLSARKKGFNITVRPIIGAYATGYELRYSTKKSMKDPVKAVIGRKTTAVSTGVKGLRPAKTYYVQVRTYKRVNGRKYYSGWSSVSSVKTR